MKIRYMLDFIPGPKGPQPVGVWLHGGGKVEMQYLVKYSGKATEKRRVRAAGILDRMPGKPPADFLDYYQAKRGYLEPGHFGPIVELDKYDSLAEAGRAILDRV